MLVFVNIRSDDEDELLHRTFEEIASHHWVDITIYQTKKLTAPPEEDDIILKGAFDSALKNGSSIVIYEEPIK